MNNVLIKQGELFKIKNENKDSGYFFDLNCFKSLGLLPENSFFISLEEFDSNNPPYFFGWVRTNVLLNNRLVKINLGYVKRKDHFNCIWEKVL